MLDFLIPISCGLIGATFTLVPAIIKDKDPLKSCFGFIFLTIILSIGAGLGYHKPTQPKKPPILIGGGIGEQRGENKRMLFTLN